MQWPEASEYGVKFVRPIRPSTAALAAGATSFAYPVPEAGHAGLFLFRVG